MMDKFKNWMSKRFKERTSWDGAALIGFGIIVLIAKPLAGILAYAAIAYGAWTIYKSE
jgi:hypothetical protein|tara:strand:- start:6580 stop:6753 length:174 start_codon:yes stop_codon:yes gene_type:complete